MLTPSPVKLYKRGRTRRPLAVMRALQSSLQSLCLTTRGNGAQRPRSRFLRLRAFLAIGYSEENTIAQ
jgi:hypothetical protein